MVRSKNRIIIHDSAVHIAIVEIIIIVKEVIMTDKSIYVCQRKEDIHIREMNSDIEQLTQ